MTSDVWTTSGLSPYALSAMSSRIRYLLCIAIAASAAVNPTIAQERDRSRIPDQYKWDLTPLYPSEQAWRDAKERAKTSIPQLDQFKGKLGASAGALADALNAMFETNKTLSRLSTYAGLLADQDTRDAAHHGMQQELTQLWSAFEAETSYVVPEILRIPAPALQKFQAGEPRLKPYRMYLSDIVRRAAHTLSDGEEKILANAGPLSEAPSETFGLLINADFPNPSVVLSDGKSVTIDQAAFAVLRGLPNRSDREKVMSTYLGALGSFSRTFGTTMNGNLQQSVFYSKSRRYSSDLEARLDGPNIPISVYSRLIDGVNRNLSTFHRYLKLRRRILGVDELHYYDLYAPLVTTVKLDYTPEEAEKNVLAALAPLGAEYGATVQRAFNERWIDLLPSEGKSSGGYSNGGAYDVHPYVLLNYNGQYVDMSALAHELGHTMHSYLSNKAQPYPMAGHAIFVAEVASLTNEALMKNYMLTQVSQPAARLSILGNYLEVLKANVFRQTQFADFELQMHQMAQRGEPITGAGLAKLYLDVTKKYYGHDQGVCVVDDYVAHEWSLVPHFYSPFYVYQYATSFTASTALAQNVSAGGTAGTEATRRYLAFLAAGGSKYPIDLLKDAGVDMTTDQPLELTIREMNRIMDEMERLLTGNR
jgi:oligoendopeptidase F